MFKELTPALIRAMMVFVVTLALSTIVISSSYIYMEDVEQEKRSAQRAMKIWQSKINNSVENNQIIEEFESNFLKLVNQGVVGSEDRLSWIEKVQDAAKMRGIPLVKYSISEQKQLEAVNLKLEYKGIDVFKSLMTFEAEMAHEGDLFSLINNLQRADGLFAIDKCDIEKVNKLSMDKENNMKVMCELGWYTFKGSNTNKI